MYEENLTPLFTYLATLDTCIFHSGITFIVWNSLCMKKVHYIVVNMKKIIIRYRRKQVGIYTHENWQMRDNIS